MKRFLQRRLSLKGCSMLWFVFHWRSNRAPWPSFEQPLCLCEFSDLDLWVTLLVGNHLQPRLPSREIRMQYTQRNPFSLGKCRWIRKNHHLISSYSYCSYLALFQVWGIRVDVIQFLVGHRSCQHGGPGFHRWGIPNSWLLYSGKPIYINWWWLGVALYFRKPPYT